MDIAVGCDGVVVMVGRGVAWDSLGGDMIVVSAVVAAEVCEVVSMAISSAPTPVGAGASSMSFEPVGVTGEEEDMNTHALSLLPSSLLPSSLLPSSPPPSRLPSLQLTLSGGS